MSEQENQTGLFTACFYPTDEAVAESGAKRLTRTFKASSEKLALAKATLQFAEDFPGAEGLYEEPRLYADAVGRPRPGLNSWDENFLYQYAWDNKKGYPDLAEDQDATLVDFNALSGVMRTAVLVKFGTTEATADMLAEAVELTQDGASTFDDHIVEAILKTPQIASMYPERQLEAISCIREKCATTKKWPEIKAVLMDWLKRREEEHKQGSEGTGAEMAQETATASCARPYKHTYATLKKEIACALWPGDVDIANVDPTVSRWADDIIKDDREDLKRWNTAVSPREKILSYDMATVFSLVRNAPSPDIYKKPDELNRYITSYLEQHGVMEGVSNADDQQVPQMPDSEPRNDAAQITEQLPPDTERQGPFYYRNTDGTVSRANKFPKLQEALAAGAVEISKEEYQAGKDAPAREEVSKQLAAQRGEYVEGLSDHTDAKWIAGQPQAPEAVANEPSPVAVASQDFQGVAARLEETLRDKPQEAQDNLNIWRNVMRTDPRFTKQMTGTGFEGTSINAEYMIMRATELFGPVGSRWGFEILEDRMIPGAPMSENIYEGDKYKGSRILRDADGSVLFEQNHSLKIRFWYQTETDEGSVYAYGATPYLFKTKHGIKSDGEAQKKSLTDALKKALSLLGFSADVWLGLYDLPEYQTENKTEFAIKNASEKAEDVTRLRAELDDKLTAVASTIESAVTPNEAKKVYDTVAREVEVHRKAAEARGDTEHARYLGGRMRRLNTLKEERIKHLTTEGETNE